MRKFAAFDIDGTIGRTSLFLQITEELIRRGHLPQDSLTEIESKYEAYKQRAHVDAFRDYTSIVVDVLLKNLRTVKLEDYRSTVDSILKNSKLYVYTYTRNLIEELRAKDYFLIALSGSEMYAVKEFAKHYKFDVAIGEEYEIKDGYFTGKIEGVFHRKEVFLDMLVKEHNLTKKGSIAIGDSMGDYTMLEFVDNPIAFNPEKRLYDEARKNGWQIVIERKNVIYELKSDKNVYRLL